MLRLDLAELTETALGRSSLTVSFMAAVIGASLKADPASLPDGVIENTVTLLQRSAWWSIPVLLIVGGIVTVTRHSIGSRRSWRLVQYVLDEKRVILFNHLDKEPFHHHRVTLYKFVRFRPRAPFNWSGWLVPVARCGHVTRTRIPVFRAPLNNPSKAEGVAGYAWACEQPIEVYGPPDVNRPNATGTDFSRYCEATHTTVEWLKKRLASGKKAPTALLGIPIEVDGKIWGVLMIDSTEHELDSRKVNSREFTALTKALTKILHNL